MLDPQSSSPLVHIVDDDTSFCDTLAYQLRSQGTACATYASGEAFLAAWRWGMRGVVALDLQFKPPGAMQGEDVFKRLLALRCPMPIVFLTGPFENDVLVCERLVSQRGDLRYLPKRVGEEAMQVALANALAREPRRYEQEARRRRLLQQVLTELTVAERRVMAKVLQGQQARKIAHHFGTREKVVHLQSAKGLARIGDAKGSWELLAFQVGPLTERMQATDLVDLAFVELCVRLRLLGPEEVQTLGEALAHQKPSVELKARLAQALPPVLALLQAASISDVRDWLKWAGQPALASTLARLPGPALSAVRDWLKRLEYAAGFSGQVDWMFVVTGEGEPRRPAPPAEVPQAVIAPWPLASVWMPMPSQAPPPLE